MWKYSRVHFGKKTAEVIVTTLVIVVSLANGGGVSAISAGQIQLYNAGVGHYDLQEDCGGTGSSLSTTNGTSTINIDYTDSSRNNRKVGVTVWLPGDGQLHPLVMFAPGRGQDSKEHAFYDRYLRATAQAGFIVAGANFSDNTTDTVAPANAQDIKFLIGKIQGDPKVSGEIDTTKGVGLIGHSDGSFSALIDGFSNSQGDSRIKSVIAADGAMYQGFTYDGAATNHPALLLMHGDADTTQNISGSQQSFKTINAPYKAFATFIGADHYHYITGDNAAGKAYTPAVDALTSSFLKQTLAGDTNGATPSAVAASFTSIFTLQENGKTMYAGNGTVSPATSASAATCCASGAAGTAADAMLTGSDNEQKIYNYLTGKGLKPFQAAGIMGNMQAESGFEPRSQEPGTTSDTPSPGTLGHGIVQWTPGTGLLPLAKNDLVTLNSLAWQLNLLWNQLTVPNSPPIDRSNAGTALKAAANIADATQAFENLYEIHAGPPQPSRIANAQGVLTKYGSGAPSSDTGSTDPSAISASCSSDASGTDCSGSAGLKLLCEAKKFDAYGYHWGGGHGDPEVFMQHFKGAVGGNAADKAWMGAQFQGGTPWPAIVDCSGLVIVAIYNAFGVKISGGGFADVGFVTSTDVKTGAPLFKPVSIDEIQPGDVIGHLGHVAIATGTGANTAFFNAENPNVALENQILLDSSWKPGWTVAGRYIGPGS